MVDLRLTRGVAASDSRRRFTLVELPFDRLRTTRRGFTLVELLVVVAIIALLLGILLPALAGVRSRAKRLAAQAQLKAVAAACMNYQLSFNAYPGYLSEDTLISNSTWQQWSGTANTVLSLLGRTVTSGSTTIYGTNPPVYYDAAKVGDGPVSVTGRGYDAFYQADPGELEVITFTDGWAGYDNFPELVDPQTGMPILCFRSRAGGTKPVTMNSGDPVFYRIANVTYTNTISTTASGTIYDNKRKSLISNFNTGNADNNLAWAVTNQSLSNASGGSNGAANGTDDVVSAGMAFISAGADGIYFNEDELSTINEYGDLSSFDDIVVLEGSRR